jgi:maleate cis-trans isomerase
MYGWRARCGLILPVDNTVMEPELYGLGLEGVSFHSARLTTSDRQRMPQQGVEIARVFPEMGVDAVVYACAETSFLGGVDANRVVIEGIESATGLPAVTATWAMVAALRRLALRRISLVTPYPDTSGRAMEEFLQRCEFDVVASRHTEFRAGPDDPGDWYQTNLQPPQVAYRLARELAEVDAEGVLISATNFRTLEVIAALEADLHRPVVTCNQAIVWWLLDRLGLDARVPDHGLLLAGS